MINRADAPTIILPSTLSLPEIETTTTKNGVKIHLMNLSSQDVVRVSVVFHAGSKNQKHPFTASALFNMLSEGSNKYSSAQVAEMLDFYGIYYDASVDRDFAIVTVSCLRKFLDVTMELLSECLCKPTFPQKDFYIYKQKRKQQLKIEREKPAYLARELFAETLFGTEHPYGFVAPLERYDTLTREHLVDYYNQFVVTQNCFVVVSGKVEGGDLSLIKDVVEGLSSGNIVKAVEFPKPTSSLEGYLEREGVQSSIRMGKLLFAKGAPDFNGMQVVAMILGGYFGSRLVQNIREDKGYTYGIYSAMVSLEHDGYFAIATDVAAQYTNETVAEVKHEIIRMQKELVTNEELNVVKNMIVGELMRILDGPFGIADVVIENLQSNMDADYLNGFLQEVLEITPQRIQDLAVKYLDSNTFSTVIVGKK